MSEPCGQECIPFRQVCMWHCLVDFVRLQASCSGSSDHQRKARDVNHLAQKANQGMQDFQTSDFARRGVGTCLKLDGLDADAPSQHHDDLTYACVPRNKVNTLI